MKRIGLVLPSILLIVFAITFHPTMKIHIMQFTNPWQYMVFSPQMFFLLSAIFVLSLRKIPPKQIGLTIQPLKKNLLLGICTGAAPFLLLGVANFIMKKFNPAEKQPSLYEMSSWMIFSYFIFAPIAEEIFFRGIVFHALKESYSITTSILASALLFAACHSSMMVGPLLLGIGAAILTNRTKSLLPAMLFHSLCNGLPWFYANHCHNLMPFEKWIFFRF